MADTGAGDRGQQLLERGDDAFHAGNFAAAVASYEAAAAALPRERRAWYNLGVACLHEGDRIGDVRALGADGRRVVSANDAWYVRAIDAFTRAHAIDPTDTPALVMRGHAWRNRLDEDKARADWTEAKRLGDPYAASLLQ
jgi:tetratricopeptide (TPR) repeat protein